LAISFNENGPSATMNPRCRNALIASPQSSRGLIYGPIANRKIGHESVHSTINKLVTIGAATPPHRQ
jgi:hypothetical protein